MKKNTISWGKKAKKIPPKLDEIKINSKWFVLREDGVLVLKSVHEADKK